MTEDQESQGQGRAVACAAAGVFVLSILMRLSSCYESFWLDELHTAWCIWDGIGFVNQRATQGNQTPLYFQMMWCWKQVVGETEIMLRLSSVMAVAASASASVIGISRITKSICSGVLAGLFFAVESNALFFGTEFRPYPWVILFTVLVIWSCARTIGPQKLRGRQAANARLCVIACVCAATLFHPTAIASLGVLVVLTSLMRLWQSWVRVRKDSSLAEERPSKSILQFTISDLISAFLIVATAFLLWQSSLSESWQHRDQWRAFGLARSYGQLWFIWPWKSLVFAPVGFGILAAAIGKAAARFVGKDRTQSSSAPLALAVLLLISSALITGMFFLASYNDIVPLWHRRYFIAVLPMLVWAAAILLGTGFEKLAALVPTQYRFSLLVSAILVSTVGLMWQQGTTRAMTSWNPVFTGRGEDWREAVAWINEEASHDDFILLDSGLIEATVLEKADDLEDAIDLGCSNYLQFPLRGPYDTGRVDCTDNQLAASPQMKPSAMKFVFAADGGMPSESVWIITRSPVVAWKPLLTKIVPERWDASVYQQHGNIAVIKLAALKTTD